jgi:hypothetical protein
MKKKHYIFIKLRGEDQYVTTESMYFDAGAYTSDIRYARIYESKKIAELDMVGFGEIPRKHERILIMSESEYMARLL